MKLRIILLLLACHCTAPAAALEETADARAARYFADGLEVPLGQLRAGAMLIQACRARLRGACDAEQVRLAAGNHILALLDALTLFPPQSTAEPAARVASARELREKIGVTSATLLQEAGAYDLALFARYGATLLACPPGENLDEYHDSLNRLRLIDLVGFQGMEPAAAAEAVIANIESTDRELQGWQQRSREDCLAARTLGEHLMQLLNAKLQPWISPELPNGAPREFDFGNPRADAAPDAEKLARRRELAHAVAGNFVSVVATELQLRVYPQSAPRIKELADRAGFPSQD